MRELAGEHVRVEPIHHDIALEVPFEGDLVDRMVDALVAEDPDATVLPYTLSGGTDNKSLARLGIRGYGFAPLRLPADLDFAGMFHGVDERVPIDALLVRHPRARPAPAHLLSTSVVRTPACRRS